MSEPILRVEDVQAKYGDFIAIESASLEVPEGKIVSLIGSNGAGKSTLMSTIAGLHKPSAGKIYFKGEDITGLSADKIKNRGLSLVLQGSHTFVRMSVEDNLIMGCFPKEARSHMKDSLEKIYEMFPVLKEKRNDLAGGLSGGQRHMVAIGRALMSNPDLILFDEVSLGLAPNTIKSIYSKIKEIHKEGTTVVLVEQDTHKAIKASEICHVMLKGKIVLSGPSKELGDDEIKKAYFGI